VGGIKKDMTDLYNIFDKRGEIFSCQCGCGLDLISHEIKKILFNFYKHVNSYFGNQYDLKLVNHSMVRCQQHNKNEGGFDSISNGNHKVSFHVPEYFDKIKNKLVRRDINACDFHVKGVSMDTLYNIAGGCHGDILTGGLGFYNTFIHIDNANLRTFDYRG